jgi:fido (protein-threonine AMPylation protein)
MNSIIGEPDGATPLELEGLIYNHVSTRGQLDELEQVNVQDGLKWLSRQKSAEFFTEGFVLELHARLFGQV